jgi:hypothetical protein
LTLLVGGRAVKAGPWAARRGEALTARVSSGEHNGWSEARQGFLIALCCSSEAERFASGLSRRAPLLISVLGLGSGD